MQVYGTLMMPGMNGGFAYVPTLRDYGMVLVISGPEICIANPDRGALEEEGEQVKEYFCIYKRHGRSPGYPTTGGWTVLASQPSNDRKMKSNPRNFYDKSMFSMWQRSTLIAQPSPPRLHLSFTFYSATNARHRGGLVHVFQEQFEGGTWLQLDSQQVTHARLLA